MTGFQTTIVIVVAAIVSLLLLAIFNRRLFVRGPFRVILGLLYRKRVFGLENLPESGCVVVCNHVSYLDGILILWMLPRNVRFVVDGGNFPGKAGEWLAGAFDTILMHPNPKSIGRALKTAREGVKSGEVIGIFPEGTITRTGQLQAFRPGLTKILKGTDDVPIVPMWLEGMWGSIFSFSGGKFFFKWPKRLHRTLTLYIGKPLDGTTSLEKVRTQVQALGSHATTEQRFRYPNLASRVIKVWKRNGSRIQAADSSGQAVSARDLLTRVLALRRMLRREVFTDDEKVVGVLLPPAVGGVVVNVALAMDQRVSANLNYTVSSEVLNHCIADVGIKHVLTSEKFLSKLDFDLDAEMIILEKLKDKVTAMDKAIAAIQARLVPAGLLTRMLGLHKVHGDDLLTIIFTSGSTGMPKGVMLSNTNISHNVDAIERAIRLDNQDTVLGILPFFHSFGYSVTLWAAQTLGPKGIYHYNPLDARQIGKLCERHDVSVLLGTPTFLRSYLRRVTPEQFKSLDVVVVGAEKMPADLFDAFEKKFGIRPVEGYGATELSPLVSVNIPPTRSSAKYQPDLVEGSVGRPLPGVSARIVSPDTGEELEAGEDGMLMITGPNVMQGYANREEQTKEAIQEGWYNTGDIAHVDKEGFLHITGRVSRFSKIGGEMVPHVKIEDELSQIFCEGDEDEEVRVCVTAVPDPKKGERLIVLHLETDREIDQVRAKLSEAGLPNLFIPSPDSFFVVDKIPMLGTGKLDLKQAKDKAAELVG